MDSHAYVIQDSDLYIKMIVDFLNTNPLDLPKNIKTDRVGLIDRNKVAIFQLLQSLNRKNLMRLLLRPLNDP